MALEEVAKKIILGTAATAAAPIVLTGEMLKNTAVSYLNRLNPLNNLSIPGLEMFRMINEMRKEMMQKLDIGSNDNKGEQFKNKDEHDIEEELLEKSEDTVEILKDIRDKIDDLLHVFNIRERRELREKKIQKHKNIEYDVKPDYENNTGMEGLVASNDNIKSWADKLLDIGNIRKYGTKGLVMSVLAIYGGIKLLDNGFTQVGIILKNIVSTVGKIAKSITSIGSGIVKTFEIVAKPFSYLFKIVKSIPFGKIIGTVGKFAGAVKGLGRYLFGPVTMTLFGIYEFVKGFIKSYNKDGSILRAVFAGFDEMVRGFVFKPLDLIKDVISWGLNKMGFENVSKYLDEFSFIESYERIKNWIGENVTKYCEIVKKNVNKMYENAKRFMDEHLPSYEEMKESLKEKWNLFIDSTEKLKNYIVDLATNPSKVWEEVKERLPDFEKLTEDVLNRIPSFEDIKKKFDEFSFERIINKVEQSVKRFLKYIADLFSFIPNIHKVLGVEKTPEENDKVVEEIKAYQKTFPKKTHEDDFIKVLQDLQEYSEKLKQKEKQQSNVNININNNQNNSNIPFVSQMPQPDMTPNTLVTTPYTSRWETD